MNSDKIINKAVINAHGSYRGNYFTVPDNIRLVLTTITSYDVVDAIHPLLTYLKENPNVFIKTLNGELAITKEGIQLQNNIRQMQKELYNFMNINHNHLSMLCLVALKSGETVRDLDIEFQSYKPEYYNPGIYIHGGNWKLHLPVIIKTNQVGTTVNGKKSKISTIKMNMFSNNYPLFSGNINNLIKTK